MRTLFLILVLNLFPVVTWAGGSIAGNGGNLVDCTLQDAGPPQPPLQMLDLFEMNFYDGVQAKIGVDGQSSIERVNSVLEKFKAASPVRAARYEAIASHFFQLVEFVQTDLTDIPDSMHVLLPHNCHVRQLAIQQRDESGNLTKITIDQRYWNQIDATQQAALILHEIIYHESLVDGQTNSILARQYLRSVLKIAMELPNMVNLWEQEVAIAFGIIERPFPDGSDILWPQNNDFEPSNPGPGALKTVIACGYVAPGMPVVDNCESQIKYYRILFDDYRIFSVSDNADAVIYQLPSSQLGLPVSVSDYILNKTFWPVSPFTTSGSDFQVTCSANQPVNVQPWGATPPADRFDLAHSLLRSCSIDKNVQSKVFVQNQWRAIGSDSVVAQSNNGNIQGTFVFSGPETLQFPPFIFEVKSLEQDYGLGSVNLAAPSTVQLMGRRCSAVGLVRFSIGDAYIPTPGFTFTEFADSCNLRINDVELSLSAVEFDPSLGRAVAGVLAQGMWLTYYNNDGGVIDDTPIHKFVPAGTRVGMSGAFTIGDD